MTPPQLSIAPPANMRLNSVAFSHEVRRFSYWFKCFGLSPFAEEGSWSVILLIYSGVLLAVTILLVCSAFFVANIFEQSSAGTLASLVGQLVFCGLIATNGIILLQAVIFRPEAKQIEERFDAIYSLMREKLLVDISANRMKSKSFWKLFSIIVFLVGGAAANICALVYYDEPLGYFLHSLWPIVIIRARCIHNIYLVDLITQYLTLFNGKLTDIVARTAQEGLSPEWIKMNYAQKDFGYLANRTPYSELMILKDVYGYIWDITNLINDTFGWSLLAVATQNFIEFTCNGYWLFLAMDSGTTGISTISEFTSVVEFRSVCGDMICSRCPVCHRSSGVCAGQHRLLLLLGHRFGKHKGLV